MKRQTHFLVAFPWLKKYMSNILGLKHITRMFDHLVIKSSSVVTFILMLECDMLHSMVFSVANHFPKYVLRR